MSTQTIKTLLQLLAEEPDNLSRFITAQVMRNLTISAFPALVNRDPTIDDDEINSSGVGFFAAGNSWINTVARSYWRCMTGNPHAASWKCIYPQSAGVTDVIGIPPIHSDETSPGVFEVSYAGPPPINPASAANLETWTEQDGTLWQDVGGTIPVVSGSPVGKWDDQSLAGHSLFRNFADANRPTYIPNAYGTFAAIRYSGSSSMNATIASLSGATEWTTFLVLELDASGNSNTVPLGANSDSIVNMQGLGPGWFVSLNGGGQVHENITGSLGGLHVVAIRIDLAAATDAEKIRMWFDGVEQTLTVDAAITATALSGGSDLWVGHKAGAYQIVGDFLAQAQYSRALSEPEMTGLNAYWTNKYLGTSIPTTQYVDVTAPLTSTGPPWAPTIGVDDFVASGSSHARGTVPDPGSTAGTTKFLREDATWADLPAPSDILVGIKTVSYFVGLPLSTLSGLTIDGCTFGAGRLAVAETSTTGSWGVWEVSSGAWTRVAWLPAGTVLKQLQLRVLQVVDPDPPNPPAIYDATDAPLWQWDNGQVEPNDPTWIVGTDTPTWRVLDTNCEITGDGNIDVAPTTVGWRQNLLVSLIQVPVAIIQAGALPSYVTIDWSQITSAPAPCDCQGGSVTGTTAAGPSWVSIKQFSATYGLMGTARLMNMSPNTSYALNFRITTTDIRGSHTDNYTAGVVGGGVAFVMNFDGSTGNGYLNPLHPQATPPFTFVEIFVQTHSGFSDSDYQLDYTMLAN